MKSRDQCLSRIIFFFFNDTATTEIYTLSLHDALPISLSRAAGKSAGVIQRLVRERVPPRGADRVARYVAGMNHQDRKSTRLNSSHSQISYAVFCLKKKNRYGHRSFRSACPSPSVP